MLTNDEIKSLVRVIADAHKVHHDLELISEALRPSGLERVAETLEFAADVIEHLMDALSRRLDDEGSEADG